MHKEKQWHASFWSAYFSPLNLMYDLNVYKLTNNLINNNILFVWYLSYFQIFSVVPFFSIALIVIVQGYGIFIWSSLRECPVHHSTLCQVVFSTEKLCIQYISMTLEIAYLQI